MKTSVVIVGAGQAGLAMSRCLTDRSIDHVLIERGEVANSWVTERWDSLRLLTPNWMTRLPGYVYRGADPDGYMTSAEVVEFLRSYRRSFAPPVHTGTTVESVRATVDGYRVVTDQIEWRARAVVVATGAASSPRVPTVAADLPSAIRQLTPIRYRNPAQIDPGRVLVVGASASGVQIADELRRSGRDVTLAVGEHVRVPRTYRGMDIHWWMSNIGLLDECYDAVDDLARVRRVPSFQLLGSPERRAVDLNALAAIGVDLVGRFVGVAGSNAQFSGAFAHQCTSADLKMNRLLDAIDRYVQQSALEDAFPAPDRPPATTFGQTATSLDLREVNTVIWATGFRPSYPWLEPRLLDRHGAIRHDGGLVNGAGMYVLGLPFTRRRNSSFLDGVGRDAFELTAHLADFLDTTTRSSPAGARRSILAS